jgi:hypothetical protein
MNMKKIVLIAGVLLLSMAGALFAQRVGDTVQLGGQTYAVESVSGGRVVLQLRPSLNGVWDAGNGTQITFSGNSAVYTRSGSINARMQDAINKGYLKIGDPLFRNVTSAGNLKWSAQPNNVQYRTSSPNVAVSMVWGSNVTITMSADGRTITVDGSETLTRQ